MINFLLPLLVSLLALLLMAPLLLAVRIIGSIARRRQAEAARTSTARGPAVIEAEGRVIESAAQQD